MNASTLRWISVLGTIVVCAGLAPAAPLDTASVSFDELRMASPQEFLGGVFVRSWHALERNADGESNPVVRQEKHAWLAEMGESLQQSDFLVARNFEKATKETMGDPELRKGSLLKLAAVYRECLGHDLPYIDQ